MKPLALLRNLRFVVRQVPGAAAAAQRELSEALGLCETMDARGMAGRCRMELGDLAAFQSRSADAGRFWAEAAEDFESCGATLLRDQARAKLERQAAAA